MARSSLITAGPTLSESEQDREADEVPASWDRWGRFRGTYDELVAGGGTFTRHERRIKPMRATAAIESEEQAVRRLRGSQAYPTLHLGKGTKWIKPGSTRA